MSGVRRIRKVLTFSGPGLRHRVVYASVSVCVHVGWSKPSLYTKDQSESSSKITHIASVQPTNSLGVPETPCMLQGLTLT